VQAIRDRVSWRRALIGGAAALACVALGVGAYLFAASRGSKLDDARALGVKVGLGQGAAAGRDEGYRRGYSAGFDASFGPAYKNAYKEAYLRQFELTDLKPPARAPNPGLGG
jgi:hypothetical protein